MSERLNNHERVLCAAYRFKEGYRTPNMERITAKDGTMIEEIYHEPYRGVFGLALGWRHPDILYKYGDIIDKSDTGGFMTTRGRYVDRYEAAKIAFEQGQIPEQKRVLYSEDLY